LNTTLFSALDVRFMQRALRLAAKGLGAVEPNPLVGAVVAQGSRFISQGYHRQYGTPHAEVHALRAAGDRAKGATLYVTLEPCCHWGKTPPCTDAILAAGIQRVVVAMIDPFAEVHGKGVALLRRKGIQVDVDLLDASAKSLNAPFITRLSQGRPYVIAKWAQSLDGCVALASGESRWISSETSRAFVQVLRGRVDAIIVGLGTALADNPLLMARPVGGGRQIHRIATRIVLDSQCRLPLDSQLLKTVPFAPVMVVHARKLGAIAERRRKALDARGVMTVGLPTDTHGRPRISAFLKHLAARDYTNVLLEGGPELMAAFLTAGLVDEAHVFIAPLIIGGDGCHAVGDTGLLRLADAPRLHFVAASRSGDDVHLIGRRK
jgi:diaminohydroxyphosphoribosylaminopyrimidine deaminase / 5-amino-6-(5-phosphoribosylamino)uracil reductase